MNKVELRELNRSRYATVLEYLKAVRELGLEITEDNKGIAHTPWAERIVEQTYGSNGTEIVLESLHYVHEAKVTKLSGLEESLLDNAGLEYTWGVDKWKEMLMELQDSMRAVAKGVTDEGWMADLENSLEVVRKQSLVLDAEVSGVCEELDDLYLELLQAKDLHEYKLGQVEETEVDPNLVAFVGETLKELDNTREQLCSMGVGDIDDREFVSADKGTKIIAVDLERGTEHDMKLAQQLLIQGNTYTVDYTTVHNFWSEVFLIEIPGIGFNLIHFDTVKIEEEV